MVPELTQHLQGSCQLIHAPKTWILQHVFQPTGVYAIEIHIILDLKMYKTWESLDWSVFFGLTGIKCRLCFKKWHADRMRQAISWSNADIGLRHQSATSRLNGLTKDATPICKCQFGVDCKSGFSSWSPIYFMRLWRRLWRRMQLWCQFGVVFILITNMWQNTHTSLKTHVSWKWPNSWHHKYSLIWEHVWGNATIFEGSAPVYSGLQVNIRCIRFRTSLKCTDASAVHFGRDAVACSVYHLFSMSDTVLLRAPCQFRFQAM